jgi:Zn-dependent protease
VTVSGKPSAVEQRRGPILGALVALGVVLAKSKGLLFVLLSKGKLLFAALKLGKFAVTGWTMALAAMLYARTYGWPFAVGLVLLILVHELGHGAAAARVGLPVGPPVFIPFFGAMIALRARPRSSYEDFYIGAGGPLVGAASAALCVTTGLLLPGHTGGLLLAVGYFGLVMNLFNLMPVWQLDGARMCAPVRVTDGAIGVAVLVFVLLASSLAGQRVNPVGLFVTGFAGVRFLGAAWRARRRPATHAASALDQLQALESVAADGTRIEVMPAQQRTAALVFFALAAVLILVVQALMPTIR